MYNRKLKEYLKVFDNTRIVEVDPQRELYTRHGLHMNVKRKEQMAKKIILTVKSMLYGEKTDLIAMSEEKHREVLATEDRLNSIPEQTTTDPSNTQMAPFNEATLAIGKTHMDGLVIDDRTKTIKTLDSYEPSNTLTAPSNEATPATEKTH
jgi:hypothetical protein